MTGDGGSGGHGGADQMGPAATALPAFEITIRGAGTSFTGLQAIRVHGQAH